MEEVARAAGLWYTEVEDEVFLVTLLTLRPCIILRLASGSLEDTRREGQSICVKR